MLPWWGKQINSFPPRSRRRRRVQQQARAIKYFILYSSNTCETVVAKKRQGAAAQGRWRVEAFEARPSTDGSGRAAAQQEGSRMA